MSESPEGWAQAPMPGATSPAPKKQEAPEEKPEEKPDPKPEKPAEPEPEKPAPPTQEAAGSDKKKGGYPTATRVNGFSNFVKSPYNDRWVKVKGIPSGSLVADPRFDVGEKKYFRVP
ncbi:hypothetical protein [Haloferula sp.]|uniref:hypothetical protein n=1 Tax=Haloferula sp. TaxID=2497595 RepID=UPI0032A14493